MQVYGAYAAGILTGITMHLVFDTTMRRWNQNAEERHRERMERQGEEKREKFRREMAAGRPYVERC